MKSLIKEYNLDGIAVRCWPELPNSKELGSWCYLALARLATEGNKYPFFKFGKSSKLKFSAILDFSLTLDPKDRFFLTCDTVVE